METWFVDQLIERILRWFADTIIGFLNTLWGLLTSTVFQSPDVTPLPQVQAFSGTSLAVVNTVYILAFLYTAVMIMGRDTVQSRYGFGELLPRLVIGLLGANFAIPLCSAIIGLANALTSALTGGPIAGPGSLRQLTDTTMGALYDVSTSGAGRLLLLIVGLVIAILAATLLVQWMICRAS
jgi:hypothetical protein